MKAIFDKFLNYELPLKERLLYITTSMCVFCSLSVVVAGRLLNMNLSGYLSFFTVALVSGAIFYLEYRNHKTQFNTHLFLFFINIFLFPLAFYFADTTEFEVPVYALIGLVFALVLLDGRSRTIHFWVVVCIVVVLFCYKFVIIQDEMINFDGLTVLGFIRTEIAILVTSILAGTTIFYRNRCLEKDMEYETKINDEAEQNSYAKDMFLVNVSHEIRTPLNAIIGTANVVLDSNASNHIKEMASNIYNSSYALLSITNDLLDFSNMTNDKMTLNEDYYDISFMLKDIINLVSVSVLDQNFNFYANINPLIPRKLYGDSGKIRQVITNFLSNACKYTTSGSVILFIDFEKIEDDYINLIIKVEDTGVGIEPEKLNELINSNVNDCEPYEIAKQGLGLSMMKRVAKVMDAKYTAESEVGKGSIFSYEVRQKIADPENGLAIGYIEKRPSICFFVESNYNMMRLEHMLSVMNIKHTKLFSDASFVETYVKDEFDYYFIEGATYTRLKNMLTSKDVDWKKLVVITSCNYSFSDEPFEYVLTRPVSCLNISDLINNIRSYNIRRYNYQGNVILPDATILIVDDNLINLDVTEGLLTPFKCNVIKATSGKDAILCIRNEPVDIVLLDYMMPEMDGIDTLKLIRSIDDGKFADLPVIAFTANAVSGARDMFVNEGFNDYISKPIELDKLVRIFQDKLPGDKVKYIV